MYTTTQELVDLGALIIAARRRVWDLERMGRGRSSFYDEELKVARREYRALLARRKKLIASVQMSFL